MSYYSDIIRARTGLVRYFRHGEYTGTVAKDETGTSNGTYNNVVLAADGLLIDDVNHSTMFGSTGSANLGNSAALNFLNGMSFESWVRWDSGLDGDDSHTLIGRQQNNVTRPFWLGIGGFGQVYLSVNYHDKIVLSNTFVSGVRYHVCLTGDATTGWKFYVNGTVVGSSAWEAPVADTNPTILGMEVNQYYLRARMQDTALYSRALTQAEVTESFTAGTVAQTYARTWAPLQAAMWSNTNRKIARMNSNRIYNNGSDPIGPLITSAVAGLSQLPAGKKSLMFQNLEYDLFTNAADKISGQTTFGFKNGGLSVQEKMMQFFTGVKAAGETIDFLSLDVETGPSYWSYPNNAAFKTMADVMYANTGTKIWPSTQTVATVFPTIANTGALTTQEIVDFDASANYTTTLAIYEAIVRPFLTIFPNGIWSNYNYGMVLAADAVSQVWDVNGGKQPSYWNDTYPGFSVKASTGSVLYGGVGNLGINDPTFMAPDKFIRYSLNSIVACYRGQNSALGAGVATLPNSAYASMPWFTVQSASNIWFGNAGYKWWKENIIQSLMLCPLGLQWFNPADSTDAETIRATADVEVILTEMARRIPNATPTPTQVYRPDTNTVAASLASTLTFPLIPYGTAAFATARLISSGQALGRVTFGDTATQTYVQSVTGGSPILVKRRGAEPGAFYYDPPIDNEEDMAFQEDILNSTVVVAYTNSAPAPSDGWVDLVSVTRASFAEKIAGSITPTALTAGNTSVNFTSAYMQFRIVGAVEATRFVTAVTPENFRKGLLETPYPITPAWLVANQGIPISFSFDLEFNAKYLKLQARCTYQDISIAGARLISE